MNKKLIIYQVFTRLFGNRNHNNIINGSITENGVGKMNDFNTSTLKRIKSMGCTHVWYTGIIRHASTTSYEEYGIPTQHPAIVKGKAGSPYAIVDYYDVDPDLAENVPDRMQEFEALLSRTSKVGLKTIIDFVPNHVARQYKSTTKPEGVEDLGENDDTTKNFDANNNFYYCNGLPFAPSFSLYSEATDTTYFEQPAKATGNDRFDNAPNKDDWYETIKLNYGVDYCNPCGERTEHFDPIPSTWKKMTDILLFWARKGVDGFRCDMAEMVPSAFWTYAIKEVKNEFPYILFIGEVYNPSLYDTYLQSGFDYLYDKVGMYDCVRGVIAGTRKPTEITKQWQATDHIKNKMLYFLENHDEQRIASPFFANDAEKGFPGVVVSSLLLPNPFMLYAGQELGEPGMDAEGFSGRDGRTTIFDYWGIDKLYRGYYKKNALTAQEKVIWDKYNAILRIASKEKVVSVGSFFDLMYANPLTSNFNSNSLYAFIRAYKQEVLLVVANFSDLEMQCAINIPRHAFEHLSLSEGQVNAVDLLTGETTFQMFSPEKPFKVGIDPYGARVYKFIL